MADLIIGYGEIGKAVKEVISPAAQVYDLNIKNNHSLSSKDVDVMHVCFPYSPDFIKNVQDYTARFQPHHIAVYSTVPIGITRQINKRAVHSPVEGKHPDLALSICYMERWISYNDEQEKLFFNGYFLERGFKTKLVDNTDFTEALKLLSTTEYGVNIEFARYKAQVAESIGMDYGLTKDWNKCYNKLYSDLGLNEYQKFILDAPEGPKGGHCVTPNARILYGQYPNEQVKIVGEL
jgi:hypothetical protein